MWFHMGIFPMNILAASHSPALYHAAMVWFLMYPKARLLMLKAWCSWEMMGSYAT